MGQAVLLTLVLAAGWLMWSGDRDPLLLTFAGLSCLSVVAISIRMGIIEFQAGAVSVNLRGLSYVPWLLREVLKANLDVARIILDPKLPIRPQLFRVKTSQRSDLGQVTYANSITLTPGTISLDVRNNRILVHALTDEAAEGLRNGEMDRRVARLEGSG